MNLVGINETIAPSNAWPTDEELKQAIDRTHELGGIALLNHWAWSHFTGQTSAPQATHPNEQKEVTINGASLVIQPAKNC